MCVAVLVESKDPTPDEIRAMARQNPDGGGIAWIDGDLVHYRRGLTAERAIALVSKLPRPYFMHWRIATKGKPIPALTHPFPIGFAAIASAEELKGMAQAVLMHNGTWQDYRKYVPHGIDADAVSDTQIAAYVVGIQGEDVLDHVPWSNAIMRAAGDGRSNITLRGSWSDHNGNQYSNLHWQKPAISYDYEDYAGYGSNYYRGGYHGGGYRGPGSTGYTPSPAYQYAKNGAGVYERAQEGFRTSEGFKTPARGIQKYNSAGIVTSDSPAGERAAHKQPSHTAYDSEAGAYDSEAGTFEAWDRAKRAVAADLAQDLGKRSKVSRREMRETRRAVRRIAKRLGRDTQPMLALPAPVTPEESDGIPTAIPESERGVCEISISQAIEAIAIEDLDSAETIKIPRQVAANTNAERVPGDEDSEIDPPHESEIDLVDLMEGSAKSRPSDRYLDRDWEAIDREIRAQGIKV